VWEQDWSSKRCQQLLLGEDGEGGTRKKKSAVMKWAGEEGGGAYIDGAGRRREVGCWVDLGKKEACGGARRNQGD